MRGSRFCFAFAPTTMPSPSSSATVASGCVRARRSWSSTGSGDRTRPVCAAVAAPDSALAISVEDANLHDGKLEAWGEPGVGACFRLTLSRTRGQGKSCRAHCLSSRRPQSSSRTAERSRHRRRYRRRGPTSSLPTPRESGLAGTSPTVGIDHDRNPPPSGTSRNNAQRAVADRRVREFAGILLAAGNRNSGNRCARNLVESPASGRERTCWYVTSSRRVPIVQTGTPQPVST